MYSHIVTEREFFIDNLLVRIHVIIEMIRWTGLAPWEFESPFPGSLTSSFLTWLHLQQSTWWRALGWEAGMILYEMCFNLKLSCNEVYYTIFKYYL